MSKNAAKNITAAAAWNFPVANSTAAQPFTNSPKKVSRFGLMPVAATASTIFSSSQRAPSPILRVIMEPFAEFPCRRPTNHTPPPPTPQAQQTECLVLAPGTADGIGPAELFDCVFHQGLSGLYPQEKESLSYRRNGAASSTPGSMVSRWVASPYRQFASQLRSPNAFGVRQGTTGVDGT